MLFYLQHRADLLGIAVLTSVNNFVDNYRIKTALPNYNPKNKFVKGDTKINRKGRPLKGEALSDILKSNPDDKIAIAEKLIALAKKGDMAAIKEYFNRTEGMPTQAVKVGGIDDAPPVKINILGKE